MRPTYFWIAFAWAAAWPGPASAEDVRLFVQASRAVPAGCSLTLVRAGDPAPGQKGHKPVETITNFGSEVKLKVDGPFDLYLTPRGQLPVAIVRRWTPTSEFKLSDHVGTLFVRGDDLPRAAAIVVAAADDPGPSEKGHSAVQKAADYQEEMVLPPGFYAVWVMPANGARAQKIADKIRIQAGRETRVPEE